MMVMNDINQFINIRNVPNKTFKIMQKIQGLQAFAFCEVIVNKKNTKPRFKIKCKS